MNRDQVNAWRVAQGLSPMVPTAADAAKAKARKQAHSANAAAHAELQRTIRGNRNRNKK